MIPGGALSERIGSKMVLGISLLLTSILGMLTPEAARWEIFFGKTIKQDSVAVDRGPKNYQFLNFATGGDEHCLPIVSFTYQVGCLEPVCSSGPSRPGVWCDLPLSAPDCQEVEPGIWAVIIHSCVICWGNIWHLCHISNWWNHPSALGLGGKN